jgi:hypothetical protein
MRIARGFNRHYAALADVTEFQRYDCALSIQAATGTRPPAASPALFLTTLEIHHG